MTQIRIKYINNDGNGFADYVNIESGTTVGQFLASKGQNAANLQVTVNREAADVGRVLQAEDRLSVTPKKIAGAAPIRIKYINNDGNGFADYVNIESGTTVGQFLASKGQNAANLQVTVNREAADVSRVLQAEDRLSVTPKKIAGA